MKVNGPGKQEYGQTFLTVSEASMVIFWPTPDFKGRIFVSSGFQTLEVAVGMGGGVLISASAEPHSAGPCTLRNSRGHNTFLSLVPPSGAVSISLCGMFKRLPLVTAQDSSTLSLTPNTSNCIQPASGKSVCVVYVCVCARARMRVCIYVCLLGGDVWWQTTGFTLPPNQATKWTKWSTFNTQNK